MTIVVPAQAPRVHYVYIPADTHEDIQELELDVPPGREVECLLDTLKLHFSRVGGEKTDAQRQAHRQHLLEQVGADSAAKLSDEMLAAALDMQMVDTVALLVNRPDSGYVGVNLYCDDQAQFKELPMNPRASNIADCCGRPTQVRGDAFLSRLFDNDDAFVRMNLSLSEVSSGAPWVAAAELQARKRMRQGDRAADFMSQLQQQKQKAPAAKIKELSPAEAAKEEGNAAVKVGDWAGAVDRYTAALALEPHLTAAANNRALALLRLERYEEAERDCCTVLDMEPRNIKALLRRAAARIAVRRTAEAEVDLRTVLEVEPHNREAALELSKLVPPPPPPPLPQAAPSSEGEVVGAESKDSMEAAGIAEATEVMKAGGMSVGES